MAIAVRIALYGAGGRMGQSLIRALANEPGARLVAALVRPGSAAIGEPVVPSAAGCAPLEYAAALDPDAGAEALVDFSNAGAFAAALALAVTHRLPFVSGTTALDARGALELERAAAIIPVVHAANFSVGIALLERFVEEAARSFDAAADIEIIETHHRGKRDAPSGTALALGEAAARGRDTSLGERARYARHGSDAARFDGEIGFSVVRAGDVVGEHQVLIAGTGERLELIHRATSRDIFARGALMAAAALVGRAPGRYRLVDLIA